VYFQEPSHKIVVIPVNLASAGLQLLVNLVAAGFQIMVNLAADYELALTKVAAIGIEVPMLPV